MRPRATRGETEIYAPKIESGVPFERRQARYPRKLADGALADLARSIKPTQSVVLPEGSKDKFTKLLKERGLITQWQYVRPLPDVRIWVTEGEPEG